MYEPYRQAFAESMNGVKSQIRGGRAAVAGITDPTVLATIVQTVVITLTLVVFIFQFRSQEKALKESAYQNLLGRYNDYILSGDPGDTRLLAELFSSRGGEPLTPEEMVALRRIMIAYGIIEEAYELYSKGWIDKYTWDQWGAWLEALASHPRFPALHRASMGMFDKQFQDFVTELLESKGSKAEKKAV